MRERLEARFAQSKLGNRFVLEDVASRRVASARAAPFTSGRMCRNEATTEVFTHLTTDSHTKGNGSASAPVCGRR
jgi:hypothetical protein